VTGPATGVSLGLRFLVPFLAVCALAATADAQTPPPVYDLFYRSDSGTVSLWVRSATGQFRWVDPGRDIDFSAQGTFAYPNLGPVILAYSGEAPGHDWVVLALKVYGTRATGSLTLFPTGEPARKVVSLFYDRDTRDDLPPAPRKPRKRPAAPTVGKVQTSPLPEVPPAPPGPPKTP